ncbi:DUF86 domain-containing protein [uncultured Pseudacidovorax sp.]|uniref:type VII toxin-antitoxin system HepT family RNase toxin n=1 Tax=uncultured Pseudacidovorax sp. TaxID=679313 RepID=UPI0025EE6CC4|nr:DUF86 domain-containing protein [uncultured Pseudacidovorax sp.]
MTALADALGNMVIAAQGWALPGSAREVFATLQQECVIDADLAAVLGRMVGFRNIAVHEYQSLDVAIVVAVIRHELDGLLRFAGLLLSRQFPDSN